MRIHRTSGRRVGTLGPMESPGPAGAGGPLSRANAALQRRRVDAARSGAHSEDLAARLGVVLGAAFTVCFLTGVLSHLHQHPVTWFPIPPVPAGAYRVSQGMHVATGLASIPLLLAKLYVVSPHLPRWPPVDDALDAFARLTLLPLVGGSVLLLFTGAANIASWYPWDFFFPVGHWWAAWLVTGAMLVHVGLQLPVLRRVFAAGADPAGPGEGVAEPDGGADRRRVSRRGVIALAAGSAGLLTLFTAGQTFPPLRRLTAFAPRRPDIGPQGFPVNRTAVAAGTESLATDGDYRLVVVGPGGDESSLTLGQLRELPRVERELPIACVEGWSASVHWAGVTLSSVLEEAGIPVADRRDREVRVSSAQKRGLYGSSTVDPTLASRDDCLLALEANGEALHPDHGAPLRLIAPNRPGVLQTKWVTSLEVL